MLNYFYLKNIMKSKIEHYVYIVISSLVIVCLCLTFLNSKEITSDNNIPKISVHREGGGIVSRKYHRSIQVCV